MPDPMPNPLSTRTVAHVLMPFSTPGNTLLEVADQLSRVHKDQGGHPLAILSHNRDLTTRYAEPVYAEHTRNSPREYFTRSQTAIDAATGKLGARRPFYGRLHKESMKAVQSHGADLVLLYEGHYAAASLPLWAQLRPRVRVVLYVHNPLSKTYSRSELRRMAGQSDAWVFCAEHLRQDALRRMGSVSTPMVTIRNGVDPLFFASRRRLVDDELRVLFVGRVAPHKGPQLLIEALDKASSLSGRPVRATIVGSGNYGMLSELTPFEVELRESARRTKAPIEFIPHAARDEIANHMARSSVICLPSVWPEGLPLVALEAMASNTPVVAFRSRGIVEACGDAALYADIGDTGQLGAVLAQIVSDPVSTSQRVAIGASIAAESTWERVWSQFGDLTIPWAHQAPT